MEIEFGRLYSLEMPDRITRCGMDEIRSAIYEWHRAWLPCWFSPNWCNEQTDQDGLTRATRVDGRYLTVPVKYSGKIASRVDRWLANSGRRLTPEQKNALGDIAARHRLQAGPVYFDFTDRFNWYAGDFGDSGSCFWGDRWQARELLEEAGAFALRVYDTAHAPQDLYGIGRAWVMPYPRFHILFNGYMDHAAYGRAHTDDITFALGQLLALFLGQDYRLISLYNEGETCGLVYINGGRGILVGPKAAIEGISSWDLEIEERRTLSCCGCDDPLDPDEAHLDDLGHTYCSCCYAQRFVQCDNCRRTLRRASDSTYYVECAGATYCQRCYDRYFELCEECGRDIWRSEAKDLEGWPLCPDCYAELAAECPRCSQRFFAQNLIQVEHNSHSRLCRACYDLLIPAQAHGYAQAKLPF